MGEAVCGDVESARRGEDEQLAPRVRDAAGDREHQQTAEERDVERDDTESDREGETHAAAERLAIDGRDA
jgi:hypothetical protein